MKKPYLVLLIILYSQCIGISQVKMIQNVNLDSIELPYYDSQFIDGEGEYYQGWYYHSNSDSTNFTNRLWKANGDTIILVDNNAIDPRSFIVHNSILYFTAPDTSTSSMFRKLWYYDGIYPPQIVTSHPSGNLGGDITVFNNEIVFTLTSLYTELISYNGVSFTVKDSIIGVGGAKDYITYQNGLYFIYRVSAGSSWNLYGFDGVAVNIINGAIIDDPFSSFLNSTYNMVIFQNKLYFGACGTFTSCGLWSYDGVNASFISNSFGLGRFSSLKIYNNKLHGIGYGVDGVELYDYDGVNFNMVQNINPIAFINTSQGARSFLEVFDNKLYFSHYNNGMLNNGLDELLNNELWEYDGMVAQQVAEIYPTDTLSSNPQCLKTAGPYMYFRANDGVHGTELWRLESCNIQITAVEYSSVCQEYITETGEIITSNYTYVDTIPTVCSGDSIITHHVIVHPLSNAVSQANYSLTAVQNNVTYQWLNCENNSEIPNETNQTYTALNNGNYAVVVTDTTTGCIDTSICHTIGGIGLEKNKAFGISLFPNPSKGVVYLQSKTNVKIEVFNTLGQMVNVNIVKQQNNSLQLNFNNHPKGTYLLKIITDQGVLVEKILIN